MAESITLQTSDSDIQQSDVLGRLSFAASNESSGSDARLIAASIYAVAESNFTSISNATSLVLATATSENANEAMRITSGGNVGIGTTSPTSKLDVSGIITATSGNSTNWNTAYSWGNHALVGYLTDISSENIQDLNNVESSLDSPLLVNEYTLIYDSALAKFKGSSLNLGLIKQGTIPLGGYNSSYLGHYIRMNNGEFAVNEQGDNLDFRVEGDTNQHLLFTDASTDRVGIGTSSPSSTLHVNGVITVAAGSAGSPALTFVDDPDIGIYRAGVNSLAFSTNGTEQIRIGPDGEVGIGMTGSSTIGLRIKHDTNANNIVGSVLNVQMPASALTSYGYWTAPSLLAENTAYTTHIHYIANPIPAPPSGSSITGIEAGFQFGNTTQQHAVRAFVSYLNSATGYERYAFIAAGSAPSIFNGAVWFANGSNSAPSIAFSSDTDTGFFYPTANNLAITTGGTERLRIDSSGKILVGTTTSRTAGPAVHPAFQFEGTNAGSASFQCIAGSAQAAVCPQILLARHRGVVGASNIVASGDSIGLIRFNGGDDTDCVSTAAQIECIIDGTPGSNDMPGSLIFSTTSDGSAVSTERMRITSAGNVGVGTNSPTERLDINSDAIRIRTAQTPASAIAAGNTGDICWDSNFIYVCVATNTWKRSSLASW